MKAQLRYEDISGMKTSREQVGHGIQGGDQGGQSASQMETEEEKLTA